MNSITKTSATNNKNIKINHAKSSPISSKQKWQSSSSHRTPSFSSNSSSSSSSFISSSLEEDFSLPNSPSTSSSGGIPFSWETIPGIPKSQILKKIDSSRKTNLTKLPLPPPVCTTKKGYITRRDPFYVALVECSKSGDVDSSVSKSLSTRFGLVNMSCKNSSSVANSVIFLPRGGQRRISCDVVKKRSG